MTEDQASVQDADKFIEEAQDQGPVLAWKNRTFTLRPGLPAMVVIRARRIAAAAQPDDDVPESLIFDLVSDVFGEQLDDILTETRTTVDELPELIKVAIEAYTGESIPLPNRKARRAETKRAG